jgi:ubiquinone/menaquinone biosynthesis C-methylase UbiE
MDRILEPEIMDDRDADAAYARADFSDSNQAFVDRLMAALDRAEMFHGAGSSAGMGGSGARRPRIVDLGCGPADVTIRLARAARQARVVGVDGSEEMLALAREGVRGARLSDRITLHHGRLPGLALPEHGFDAVVSKDMLHHLPDPHALWGEVSRLGAPGAVIQVMDLIRPDSPVEAREIVERVAAREHPLLKEDFYHSLCAAFTVEEVREQLRAAGLPLSVERAGDRHMMIRGVLGGGGGAEDRI